MDPYKHFYAKGETMSKTSELQLSPEVIALQNLLLSAHQASPELWDSVASALNAADAAVIVSVTAGESPAMRITSAGDTTAASRMEECNG